MDSRASAARRCGGTGADLDVPPTAHRKLPDDFDGLGRPAFHKLATAEHVGDYCNWTLDELLHAAKLGFDGICVNKHHQNDYGFMPGPT